MLDLNLGDGQSLLHLCLAHNILHNHCFQFLLGITAVPKEIENNGHAIFFLGGGGGGGNQGRL